MFKAGTDSKKASIPSHLKRRKPKLPRYHSHWQKLPAPGIGTAPPRESRPFGNGGETRSRLTPTAQREYSRASDVLFPSAPPRSDRRLSEALQEDFFPVIVSVRFAFLINYRTSPGLSSPNFWRKRPAGHFTVRNFGFAVGAGLCPRPFSRKRQGSRKDPFSRRARFPAGGPGQRPARPGDFLVRRSYHARRCLKILSAHAPGALPLLLSHFTIKRISDPNIFVKSSRISRAANFFIALWLHGRYNSKTRQASRRVSHDRYVRSQQHSGTSHYSGSGSDYRKTE